MAGAQFLARARRDRGSERGPPGWGTRTLAFLVAALAVTLSARGFRQWRERRVGSIRLTYPDRTIRVPRGFSVLEASLRRCQSKFSGCPGCVSLGT
jgi:hypothetical protein